MLKDNASFLRAITLSFIISIQILIILYIFMPTAAKTNKYDVRPSKVTTFVNSMGTTETYYDYKKFDLTEWGI